MSTSEELDLSKEDLAKKAEILVEAEAIKDDVVVYRAVTKYMKEKSAKYNRIADLRNALNDSNIPNREEKIERTEGK